MNHSERIQCLMDLKTHLLTETDYWERVYLNASQANQWFVIENIHKAVDAIIEEMLIAEKLEDWYAHYGFEDMAPKRIGIVMAGNLPLVGFADWLAVYISGHQAVVKCSDKDGILFPALMQVMREINPDVDSTTVITDRLRHYDAVIATGSDNAALYFEQYFSHVPHIFRKNRTSIAVLNGSETDDEIRALGEDVDAYFGLGCRNVSFIMAPRDYDMTRLLAVWESEGSNIQYNKYKNNFDYNFSIYLLNKVPFHTNNQIIIVQDPSLFSRIACVNYQFYDTGSEVDQYIDTNKEKIQCVVSNRPIEGVVHIQPGLTQRPGLMDYADGVDTMMFLKKLGEHHG